MVDEFTKGSSLFVSLHAYKYSSSEAREGKRKTIRSEQDRKRAGGKKEEEKYWKGVEGEVFSICLSMSGFIWTPFLLSVSPNTTVRYFKK